jgi:hypothetical protein
VAAAPAVEGGIGFPLGDVVEEWTLRPGGAEALGGTEDDSPPTVDPLTTTFDPVIPAIPPIEGPTVDDSKEFVVPPPTRGGTPGIPNGGENIFADKGGAAAGAAGGPMPATLIPGYVCRLVDV